MMEEEKGIDRPGLFNQRPHKDVAGVYQSMPESISEAAQKHCKLGVRDHLEGASCSLHQPRFDANPKPFFAS